MVQEVCHNCGSVFHWHWEEAFNKFGFGDGDGQVETAQVVSVLNEGGFEAEPLHWGLHNTIIVSIKKDGIDLIPVGTILGYDDPRIYLPEQIIALLDRKFPSDIPYCW